MKRHQTVAVALLALSAACAGMAARQDLMSAMRVGWQVLMAEVADDPIMQMPEVAVARAAFEAALLSGDPMDLKTVAVPVLEGALRAAIDSRVDEADSSLRALLHSLVTELRLSIEQAIGS